MSPTPPAPEKKPDHRTKDAEKSRSGKRIRLICERVMKVRGVEVETLFLTRRESSHAVSARSLAMAACCATGIPVCHVARAFGRSWSTVHSAELVASRRYRNSAEFRKEWDEVTEGARGGGG